METSNSSVDEEELLPISDAAALAQVSVDTLRRWADARLVPCQKVGDRGHRRFRRGDIAALKASA